MSREFDIDMELRRLFAKMVRDEITDEERAKLHDLQRERVQRLNGWWHTQPPQHP
jgi:hypothetical protein